LLSSPVETQEEKASEPEARLQSKHQPEELADWDSPQPARISQLIAKFNVAPKAEITPLQRRNSQLSQSPSSLADSTTAPDLISSDSLDQIAETSPSSFEQPPSGTQISLDEGAKEKSQLLEVREEIAHLSNQPLLSIQEDNSPHTKSTASTTEIPSSNTELNEEILSLDLPTEVGEEESLEDKEEEFTVDDDVSLCSSTHHLRHTKSLGERTHGHLLAAPVTMFGRKKSVRDLSDSSASPLQKRSFTTPPRSVSFASSDPPSPCTPPKRDENGMIIPSHQLAKYISIHKQQSGQEHGDQTPPFVARSQSLPAELEDSSPASSLTREEMILKREPFKSFRKLIQTTEGERHDSETPELALHG
jgi:hypothetical protein